MIASQNANIRANSIEACVWIFKPSAKALPYQSERFNILFASPYFSASRFNHLFCIFNRPVCSSIT